MDTNEHPDIMGISTPGFGGWQRNDDLRQVEYTDGSTRPYTLEENEAADRRAANAIVEAQKALLLDSIKNVIADLNAEQTRVQTVLNTSNATINASPATYIKDNSRAIKRVARVVKDLARLVGDNPGEVA